MQMGEYWAISQAHIPNGLGYQRRITSVLATRLQGLGYALRRIAVGICWDQWFPEPSAMALMGAELLFFQLRSAPSRRLHYRSLA